MRQRGNSNATINPKMAALGKLLRKTYKMGDIHSLPEFRRQKERAGRIRFVERDEEARLFATIKSCSEDAYRLSVFLVDSGCRLGEALRLIWNDLQEHRVSFWITKSGRSRTIPMTERVKEVVKLPPAEGRRPKGPFTKLSQAQFRAIWNAAKAEVGLGADDQVVPHILRHTCASRLVQGGIDIRRVQMWLGHQTLSMTIRTRISPPTISTAALPCWRRLDAVARATAIRSALHLPPKYLSGKSRLSGKRRTRNLSPMRLEKMQNPGRSVEQE